MRTHKILCTLLWTTHKKNFLEKALTGYFDLLGCFYDVEWIYPPSSVRMSNDKVSLVIKNWKLIKKLLVKGHEQIFLIKRRESWSIGDAQKMSCQGFLFFFWDLFSFSGNCCR